MDTPGPDRQQIRNRIRQLRRDLTPHEQHIASLDMSHQLAHSRLFKNSQHIAFYLANDGEMDVSPLIELAWSMNKTCYLPVLGLRNSRKMWFIPYHPGSQLVNNRFGIPEPLHRRQDRLLKAQFLDLILMPLVAFDANGNRLGMGGGFYDRTLQFLLKRNHWRKPHLVGTAYDFQEVTSLPNENWDVPLQGIATETRFQRF